MARIRQTISGSTGASENSIVFFPAGGHSHNGKNSTLIDTTAYSVYDFSPTFVGTDVNRDRSIRQESNRIAFEDLIKRVVNSSVLEPAGIRLNPGTFNGNVINANTITADQIAANTITADELVSNIVLINNVIRSSNYAAGSAGWIISNTGSAEFNQVTVRGTIEATSGNIAGWTINTSNITGGSTILYSNGYINAAAGSFTGTISAASGNIAGWTINSSNITGGSTTLNSNGTVVFGNTTIFSNGKITNGNFTVEANGKMTATGANFSGSITGTTTAVADVFIRESTGGNYFLTYLLGDYFQVKRTQSDYSTVTGTGAFLGYYNASSGADETYLVLNTLSPWPSAGGAYAYIKNDGTIATTGAISGSTYNGYTIQSSGFNNGIALRYSGDARLDSNYFVGYGTVAVGTGASTNLRRRNADGYFLIEGSRREYKQDIEYIDYESCKNILLSLKPVKFNWKKEFNGPEHPNPLMNQINIQNKEYGFIVQEVEDSSPELVTYLDDNDEKIPEPMMWQQNGVISILVKTVQELIVKIEKIENKIVQS